MASPFTTAGAQSDPSRSAPLHTNRFFTGLWTQRSPLRDAATPYLQEKFYSATRFDSLIGGVNTEITTRLTLARRPGSSVYNSASIPPFNRLYPFRTFQNGVESIRVIGDISRAGGAIYGTVRDVTGPSTNKVLFQKQTNNKTSFQAVGSELFFVDGTTQRKYVTSTVAWTALTVIAPGTFIIDPTYTEIQYTVNGGTTGATYPAFGNVFGVTTTDGTVTWICKGSAVSPIGSPGPKNPPNPYAASVTAVIPPYAATTWYGTLPATITGVGSLPPSNAGYVQILQTAGSVAATAPTFATTAGATTNDGTCVWKCQGANTWVASQALPLGYILCQLPIGGGPGSMYQVTTAGTTGASAPTYLPGNGSLTQDGTVVWTNFGDMPDNRSSYAGGATSSGSSTLQRGFVTQILDSNGRIQNVELSGASGAAAPTWATMQGAATTCTVSSGGTIYDMATFIAGRSFAAGTGQWYYAYAWKNSVTQHVTTASPRSAPIVVMMNGYVILQGVASADPQYDTIVIYRTDQGGSTLFELAEIASPATPGAYWTYMDLNDDTGLNILIQAQIAATNNPPPANLSTLDYHVGRLWGFAGNVLRYSGGPDTLTGSGNEAWPPLYSFTLPSKGIRTWTTSIGLIVFTESDVYIVLGNGTTGNPFYITMFQQGIGLLSYDAFTVNGSTAYFMTTAYRLVSFDPSAGETEAGFPIGDLLAQYTMQGTVMAYHEGSSADTALYVADGTVGWYRMSTVNAPESGMVWSPQAQVVGGVQAVASVEVSPGVKKLLLSSTATGPILCRDATVYADNGAAYPAKTVVGSIVVAQPGQVAGIEFLTLDSIVTGSHPSLGLLLGEISGPVDTLVRTRQDPTLLPPSTTIWGDRYYMSQNQRIAWCRHMQVTIQWATEAYPNELLSYTIFGEIKNEYEVAA